MRRNNLFCFPLATFHKSTNDSETHKEALLESLQNNSDVYIPPSGAPSIHLGLGSHEPSPPEGDIDGGESFGSSAGGFGGCSFSSGLASDSAFTRAERLKFRLSLFRHGVR
jgi:hypothetical protein